jgi:hypothetical protein
MAFARCVVIEPAVQEYLDQEIRSYPRLEHIFQGLEWRLARQPELGYPVPNSNPRRFLAKTIPYRFPVPLVLTVMYRYTESEVIIELARVDADTGKP